MVSNNDRLTLSWCFASFLQKRNEAEEQRVSRQMLWSTPVIPECPGKDGKHQEEGQAKTGQSKSLPIRSLQTFSAKCQSISISGFVGHAVCHNSITSVVVELELMAVAGVGPQWLDFVSMPHLPTPAPNHRDLRNQKPNLHLSQPVKELPSPNGQALVDEGTRCLGTIQGIVARQYQMIPEEINEIKTAHRPDAPPFSS